MGARILFMQGCQLWFFDIQEPKVSSPGPMSEISSDLIGRARARGRIRVRSRTFFRSDLEVEPEPLLEVQMIRG